MNSVVFPRSDEASTQNVGNHFIASQGAATAPVNQNNAPLARLPYVGGHLANVERIRLNLEVGSFFISHSSALNYYGLNVDQNLLDILGIHVYGSGIIPVSNCSFFKSEYETLASANCIPFPKGLTETPATISRPVEPVMGRKAVNDNMWDDIWDGPVVFIEPDHEALEPETVRAETDHVRSVEWLASMLSSVSRPSERVDVAITIDADDPTLF